MPYIIDQLVKLCNTPSPTGDTREIMQYLQEQFENLGLSCRMTNKGALIATLPGKDDERHRVLSGHVDTLGAMVSEIKSNGRLKFTNLGGYMMHSVEGEHVRISTACGRTYTGTVLTTKASTHVYGQEAHKLDRVPANMEIRIDEKVKNKEETKNLGISVGDFIYFDPRTEVTPSGFIKSRHLDDKASVAVMLGVAKYYRDNNLQPAATTHFFITNFEEVGHGASYGTPEKTTEFIAVDMGCVGAGLEGNEFSVSICAKDSGGPYDLGIRRRLVRLAEENNIPYAVDIFPFYGSDAGPALRAGNDIRTGLIGPGVDASHAHERTHQEALLATGRLLIAYLDTPEN
ncbi:MAG: M42 family metallopeptidase [Firmicutes bacterium]|nr:M42 family metallopeptidase [Bacillota bacterium]